LKIVFQIGHIAPIDKKLYFCRKYRDNNLHLIGENKSKKFLNEEQDPNEAIEKSLKLNDLMMNEEIVVAMFKKPAITVFLLSSSFIHKVNHHCQPN
jgi:hypothetical protein